MTASEPIDEQAACDAFLAALGEPGLEAFRQLVAAVGSNWATMEAANCLTLSDNDRAIFAAVAHRLHHERIEAQQTQEATT